VLEKLVNLPYFDKGDELIQFYNNFIKDFEKKMNQLTLVKLALRMTRQIHDPVEGALFVQKLSEKMNPEEEKEALALCQSEIAWLYLKGSKLEESQTTRR